MASGTIPAGPRISSISIDGQTDYNGNVLISTLQLNVVRTKLDDSGGSHIMGVPFVFTSGYTYLHVTTTNGAALPSGSSISGTVWHLVV